MSEIIVESEPVRPEDEPTWFKVVRWLIEKIEPVWVWLVDLVCGK